jgi:hypothetical protein
MQSSPYARTIAKWLFALICGSLVLFGGVLIAFAHHTDSIFPTGNLPWSTCPNDDSGTIGFCQTDTSTLTYSILSPISATGANMIYGVLVNDFSPTDLRLQYFPTPTLSGSAETDIVSM